MISDEKQLDRRFMLLVVFGVVLALTAVMSLVVGCAPQGKSEQPAAKQEQGEQKSDGASAMDGQPVNWTMDSDCNICHVSEAEGVNDTACAQAQAHQAQTCNDCHTMESELSTAHADVKFGDKVPTKPSVITVDPESCIACHGTLDEVAALTADSTALTDSNGVTVNPHERPAGASHDENPATCTDCHNNHSKDLSKDAMKYCAQCHHRGVFQCGTCHELRTRN